MPGLPSLSVEAETVVEEPIAVVEVETALIVRRAYTRKAKESTAKPVKETVKRLKKAATPRIVTSDGQEKRGRGRPRKNTPALSTD